MDNKQKFGELLQEFHHHIGGIPGAHPNATNDVGGFMSAEAFQQHQQLFKTRTFITDDNGVDIFSLEPGFYTSNRFKNGPTSSAANNYIDQWQAQLDITQGYSGSRIYRYTVSNNGDAWTCTVHFDQSLEDGSMQWMHEVQEVNLWSGFSSLKSPLKLSGKNAVVRDGSWLYSRFRIEYQDSIGQYNVMESKSSRKITLNSQQVNSVNNTIFFETANISFNSDNTVTLDSDATKKAITNTINNVKNVLVLDKDVTPALKITGIWGIK